MVLLYPLFATPRTAMIVLVFNQHPLMNERIEDNMTAHWDVPRTTPRVQPPFREPRFNIDPDTRKTILVQSSLVPISQT
jgi:hypothetical protein